MFKMNSVILLYNILIFMIICVNSVPLHQIEENGLGDSVSHTSDEEDFILGFKLEKRSHSLITDLPPNIENRIAKEKLSPLNENDFKRAKLLTVEDFQPMNNLSTHLNNPLYFEGDIAENVLNRNAIRSPRMKWPNGRIPYVVSDEYGSQSRAIIARAFQEYHDKTCIRFAPKTDNDTNYIYIYPSSGCASQVGRVGGMQVVSIGQGCTYVGIIEHELMHAIGFWHEQSRADRDKYVRIIWKNIQSGMDHNFDKYSINQIQNLGERYDYSSVMHYGSYAFSRGNEPTIIPLTAGVQIGQRYALSKTDIIKINKLYNCHDYLHSNSSYYNALDFGQ